MDTFRVHPIHCPHLGFEENTGVLAILITFCAFLKCVWPPLEHSSHSVPFLHSYILLFSIPFHRENPMPQIQARDLPRESRNMVFYKRGGPVRIYLLLFLNSALKSSADKVFSRFSSVQFTCSVMSNSLRPHELQHARPPCPSPTSGVHSNSCP